MIVNASEANSRNILFCERGHCVCDSVAMSFSTMFWHDHLTIHLFQFETKMFLNLEANEPGGFL